MHQVNYRIPPEHLDRLLHHYRATYNAWHNARQRCYNEAVPGYGVTGQLGIRVEDRWLHSFETFLEDVGPRPSPGHALVRLNTSLHYQGGNVQWAELNKLSRETRRLTASPRTRLTVIAWRGQSKTPAGWAEEFGISKEVLLRRYGDYGHTMEEIAGLVARRRQARRLLSFLNKQPVGRPALARSSRRRGARYTHGGQTLDLREWSAVSGVNINTLHGRIKRGWTMERALTPVRRGGSAGSTGRGSA